MSKIDKRIKVGRTWKKNPLTKVKKCDKIYKRQEFKKSSRDYLDELDREDEEIN